MIPAFACAATMPRLQLLGRVIGTAMQKTAKVQVDRYAMHPLYKKVRFRCLFHYCRGNAAHFFP